MKKKFFSSIVLLFVAFIICPIILIAQSDGAVEKEALPTLTASRMSFVNFANTMLGVEFRLGGEKPETGFDSFGLVKYSAMKSLGKKLPKDSQKLYDSMESHPKKKDLIPGDLVFFKSNPNGKITDVGIYLGVYQVEGKYFGKEVFLYASARPVKIGKRKKNRPSVAIADMNDYVFKTQYFGAGRFLSVEDATIKEMTQEETSDILIEEKVKSSDLENVTKEVDSVQLESGVGEQFAEAEQKAEELIKDLKSVAIEIAGGENKFKVASDKEKADIVAKAAEQLKKLGKYAGVFTDTKTSSVNASASSTKITETSIGILASTDASDARLEFIQYSMQFLNNPHVPYVWGGTSPKGFDCSGFVQYSALHGVNINLPRTAAAMSSYAQSISRNSIEPGDLVFFRSGGKVSHVGIYLGKYRGSGRLQGREVFINAASAGPSTGVTLSALDEPTWRRTFCGSGRILPSATDSSSQLDFAVASLLK